MLPDIERFPFKKGLGMYALLKGGVIRQEWRVNYAPFQCAVPQKRKQHTCNKLRAVIKG